MSKDGSIYSLEKADLRPGDFGLRGNARQMFGNFVEMSPAGGSAAMPNVRKSASVVETPVYAESKLWQIELLFSAPRAAPPVPPAPWLPATASPFDLAIVTLRAALDRDKVTTTGTETLTPLDGLTLGQGVAAYSPRFQAGHQVGISVELRGPGTGIVGVQASIVEVDAGARDGYSNAEINALNALTPFPQLATTQIFLAPNARRRQFFVQNWGTAPLFVQFGQAANGPAGGPPTWTVALPSRGDIYESPRDCWLGYVSGRWSLASVAATDFAMVTEGT
jgi:hypothetical protein